MATLAEILAGEKDKREEGVASPEAQTESLADILSAEVEDEPVAPTDEPVEEIEEDTQAMADAEQEAQLAEDPGVAQLDPQFKAAMQRVRENDKNRNELKKARARALSRAKKQNEMGILDTVLHAIAGNRYGTENVESVDQMVGEEAKDAARGFEVSYDMGERAIELGRLYTKIKKGEQTAADLDKIKELERLNTEDQKEVEGKPFAAKAMGQFAPFLVNSAVKGGKGALIGSMVGGAAGGVAGNLIPGFTMVPEEALTVTGGATVGAKIGASFNAVTDIADIEGGLAYAEFRKMGMDDKKAAIASDFVGTGSGMLELAQLSALKKLIPGGQKIVSGAIGKAMSKVLGNNAVVKATAKQAKHITEQASVETLQEFWKNVAEVAARNIHEEADEKDLSTDFEQTKEILTSGLLETFASTVVAFGGFGLPTAAVDVSINAGNTGMSTKPGVTVVTPRDDTADVDVTEADPKYRPSAAELIGGGAQDGKEVSSQIAVPDSMAIEQYNQNDAIKNVVTKLATDRGLKQKQGQVNAIEQQMDTLRPFLDEAVMNQDPEEALAIANMINEKAQELGTAYTSLVELSATKADMNNSALDPQDITEIQAHVGQIMDNAAQAVQQQTVAVNKLKVARNQAYIDDINTEKGLKDELIKTSVDESRLTGKTNKINNAVVSEIMNREAVGQQAYLEKVNVDKLNKIKLDAMTQRMKDQQDPSSEGTNRVARLDAVIGWIDQRLSEKAELNLDKARQEKADVDFKRQQEDFRVQAREESVQTREAEAKAKAETVKRTAEQAQIERRKKTEADTAARAKKTQETIAKERAAEKIRQAKLAEESKVRQAEEKLAAEKKAEGEKIRAARAKAQAKKVRDAETARKKERQKKEEADRAERAKKGRESQLEFQESDRIDTATQDKARKVFKAAALKIGGKVYKGASHLDAIMKNNLEDIIAKGAKIEEGFVQHDGTFTNREQASKMIGVKRLESAAIRKHIEVMAQAKRKVNASLDLTNTPDNAVTSMADVFDAVKGRYNWLHTLSRAMGVRTNIVFDANALRNNENFQKLNPQLRGGILRVFKDKLGLAVKTTGDTFINAKNLMGRDIAKADETLAHEALHGVVRKKLKTLPEIARVKLDTDLQKLWASIPDDVKEAGAKITEKDGRKLIRTGINQIDANIQELITYAMTSPEFAKWLNTIPSTDKRTPGQKVKTVWDKLVTMIAKLVNPSKLNDVRNILNERLDLRTEIKEVVSKKKKAQPATKPAKKATKVKTEPTTKRKPARKKIYKPVELEALEVEDDVARAANKHRHALDQISDMADKAVVNEMDEEFLRTGNDGKSVLGKIHEWRAQAELNVNRLTSQLEQEFLDKFGGRKTRMVIGGSGRRVNTANTELLQKAMNLYIDSGNQMGKVESYLKKLEGKKLTNREKDHIDIIDRMMAMSKEEKDWADQNIRKYYDELLQFAQEKEIINSQVDNYVKRQWEMPKEYRDAQVTWSGTGTSGFKLTPSSGKQRVLDSIIDGWELGLNQRADGAIANMKAYADELGYVMANRRFVEYMKDMVDFDTEGLMFELDSAEEFKSAQYGKVNVRGMSSPGKNLYARMDLAKELNKLQEEKMSAFWDHPVTKFIRRINASIKGTLLSVSLFHHFAGMRSWAFGVSGITPIQRVRVFKAYREGLKKIDERTGFKDETYKRLGPVVDLLVREGLTLGAMQDFDEISIQESFFEDVLTNRTGKLSRKTLNLWRAARRKKRSLTTGLFNRLFAGLKAEAASAELVHKIKKIEKKQGRPATDAEIKSAAMQVAELINADFGGLNLARLKRNKGVQRAMQMLMLAPDWTESNWRTILGSAPLAKRIKDKFSPDPFNQRPDHMHKVYRKFWRGIMARGLLSAALAQAAVLAFADGDELDEYWTELSGQFSKQFSKGRWMDVDITAITRKLGLTKPGKRQKLSVMGHFRDILKVADPATLIKHKISPIGKIGETLLSGTDWKGDRFSELGELLETGKLVQESEKYDTSFWSTLPAAVGYNLRSSIPIMSSELLQWASGESSGLAAVSRSLGLDVRDRRAMDVNERMFWDYTEDIKQLDDRLDEATRLKDSKMKKEVKEDMREFEGGKFNRIKSRIGFTRVRLGGVNDKIKTLKMKVDNGVATDRDIQKLNSLLDRKRKIYADFARVIGR